VTRSMEDAQSTLPARLIVSVTRDTNSCPMDRDSRSVEVNLPLINGKAFLCVSSVSATSLSLRRLCVQF
jgi:hypothetical protein